MQEAISKLPNTTTELFPSKWVPIILEVIYYTINGSKGPTPLPKISRTIIHQSAWKHLSLAKPFPYICWSSFYLECSLLFPLSYLWSRYTTIDTCNVNELMKIALSIIWHQWLDINEHLLDNIWIALIIFFFSFANNDNIFPTQPTWERSHSNTMATTKSLNPSVSYKMLCQSSLNSELSFFKYIILS